MIKESITPLEDGVLPGELHAALLRLLTSELEPEVQAIDKGFYPKDFLQQAGRLGAFSAALPEPDGGLGLGLPAQLAIIALIAQRCGATAFLAWCQSICAWYVHQSENRSLRQQYLRAIARGDILAGTGMSNAVKHLAGIERINLHAKPLDNGYLLQGALPWVSNLASGHLLIAAASVPGQGYVMFVLHPDQAGLIFRPCPPFAGMEGTATVGVHLKNLRIANSQVLARPEQFEAYMRAIKPAFLLTQAAMGMGLTQASIASIEQSNQRLAHVNRYLDDQAQDLLASAIELQRRALALAAEENRTDMLSILRVRATSAELCLRAAQSAALHAGASGYLLSSAPQRRLREALFVAIVTPALKHLRKEIDRLEHARAA